MRVLYGISRRILSNCGIFARIVDKIVDNFFELLFLNGFSKRIFFRFMRIKRGKLPYFLYIMRSPNKIFHISAKKAIRKRSLRTA